MKTVVSIVGIRPDFIRMSEVFKKLDESFNHIMVHTGQHYDKELSDIFFKDLCIREPDYILNCGMESKTHYEQLSYLSKYIIELFKEKNIDPDIILFLGDSHSVLASVPLFKEGYKIGHIEGGMRSYDRRMPEEVNRVCCDYASDLVFVYTRLYKNRLIGENKPCENIFVVGNTITEVVKKYFPKGNARNGGYLIADIHRNENLQTEQYRNILAYLGKMGDRLGLPVLLVKFNRAVKLINKYDMLKDIPNIELCGPYGFLDYLKLQKKAYAVISDSGTAQEECPLLGVPVIVPRNYTERPESEVYGNSILIGEDNLMDKLEVSCKFLQNYKINKDRVSWLGDGTTSEKIRTLLLNELV